MPVARQSFFPGTHPRFPTREPSRLATAAMVARLETVSGAATTTAAAGGDSVSLSGTGSGVHNTGALLAGNGGRGGNIIFSGRHGGNGGNGGIGVRIAGAGGQVTNEGTIQGGRYGDAGVGPIFPPDPLDPRPPAPQIEGTDGVGGMGIYFAAGSATVINSGTISGGLNFSGSHAEAIHFNGSGNRLEIRAGSVINGKVQFRPGDADNTLALGEKYDQQLIRRDGLGGAIPGLRYLSQNRLQHLDTDRHRQPCRHIGRSRRSCRKAS